MWNIFYQNDLCGDILEWMTVSAVKLRSLWNHYERETDFPRQRNVVGVGVLNSS